MSNDFFQLRWLSAALCAGALCTAVPAQAAVEDFLGTWVNVGRNDSGITHVVVTRTGLGVNVEIYGDCDPPSDAIVMLRGVDPKVGQITKYALIEPHGNLS